MAIHRHLYKMFKSRTHSLFLIFVSVCVIFSAYCFGAYSYQYNLFPLNLLAPLKNYFQQTAEIQKGSYDEFGRLIAIPAKQEVVCPSQTEDTAVLLILGQSNSANHAEKAISTKHPQKVFNYFAGKCYVASSPLLGTTGEGGEFMTPLADALIDSGTYKNVVIVASGISGTTITRWQVDGDLNHMLKDTLSTLIHFKITEIVWHQGETDFGIGLNSKIYEKSFHSLQESLRNIGIFAPFFIAVATKCGDNPTWKLNNPVALAQKSLENKKNIILAVNTDELLTAADRRSDLCHLSESGQYKVGAAYATAISQYRKFLLD